MSHVDRVSRVLWRIVYLIHSTRVQVLGTVYHVLEKVKVDLTVRSYRIPDSRLETGTGYASRIRHTTTAASLHTRCHSTE